MKIKPHYHWQLQRLTALFLIFALPLLLGLLFHWKTASYQDILLSLRNPVLNLFIALTIITCLYHAVLGLQVVIMDYLKGMANKVAFFLTYTVMGVLVFLTFVSLLTILLGN